MAICLKVGPVFTEVGTSDFFHSFFSTISAHLEPSGWGTRFPLMMNHLYNGRLDHGELKSAFEELLIIKKELSLLSPNLVVWDIEDRAKLPPWGVNISPDIKNLSHYFVTSTGRDLLKELIDNIETAMEANLPVTIEKYPH